MWMAPVLLPTGPLGDASHRGRRTESPHDPLAAVPGTGAPGCWDGKLSRRRAAMEPPPALADRWKRGTEGAAHGSLGDAVSGPGA